MCTPPRYPSARAENQLADRKAAGDPWKGSGHGLVFTTKNGTPIEPRNLNCSFEVLCVRKVRAVAMRYAKRGYVYLGTVTAAALLIWLRA
ncbi:hypothetical protein [Streptomyces sp. NPDC029674]|uniref:hypothetical protein n=1 Tax=Streptomyces sp. NPDC029674 TaxID=3365297 RepID=UPI00384CA274